jgi:multisubunit Na+/H+ antiporter MnhC subunit
MPAALHAELAQAAEREGVSLNQFITRALAGKIGWGTDPDAADGGSTAPARDDRRTSLIAVALVVNAIVIGLAAAAAIGVLVLAWRG